MASSRPTSSRLSIKSEFLKTFGCQQQTMSTCPKHGLSFSTRPSVVVVVVVILYGLGSLSLLRSPLRKINEIFMRKFVNFFSGLSCVCFPPRTLLQRGGGGSAGQHKRAKPYNFGAIYRCRSGHFLLLFSRFFYS